MRFFWFLFKIKAPVFEFRKIYLEFYRPLHGELSICFILFIHPHCVSPPPIAWWPAASFPSSSGCLFFSAVVVVLFQKERKKYSIGVAMQTDGSLENSRTGHGRKLERCIRSSKDPKKGISWVLFFFFSIYFMGINLIIFHDCCHCRISTLVSQNVI